jgi:hypothetical protein
MTRLRTGRAATLAVALRDTHRCVVCEGSLTPRAHVVWTVGRGRLHEECLANARMTAAEDRLRSVPARILPLLLRGMRVRACGSCLALRLGVSLQDARALMRRLDRTEGLNVVQMPCASCGRHVEVLCGEGERGLSHTPS